MRRVVKRPSQSLVNLIHIYEWTGAVAEDDLDRFAAQLSHEPHRTLFAYWRRRADGRLPSRREIDPVDIPAVLPSISLTDVVRRDDGRRYRRRLVGTAVVETFGQDNTGRWVDEVYRGESLAQLIAAYEEVVETARPRIDHCTLPVAGRDYVSYDRLTLPLADDGRVVDVLLQSLVFTNGGD